MQGAGGVGGLLAAIQGSLTYHYCYDANGNVGQMIDAGNGSVAAHYEYDPYGNEVRAAGAVAGENEYRFSTKFFDDEVKLYYYGFRYYSPEFGHWINRDPIEEEGGVHLTGFTNNNPINAIDILGKWMPGTHKDITKDSFKKAKSILQSYIPEFPKIIKDMEERLVWGNVSQDYSHGTDHRRHYTYTGNAVPEEVASNYIEYLKEEMRGYDSALEIPNIKNCAKALDSLGLLSHSWQDYYGHGVLNKALQQNLWVLDAGCLAVKEKGLCRC